MKNNIVVQKLDDEIKNLQTINYFIESGQAEANDVFIMLNESLKRIDNILKDSNNE